MKQNNINELPRLNIENFENIFDVQQDENKVYFYNLLQTVAFPENLPKNLFTDYVIQRGDTWPYISFKTLKSPNLWWLLLLANDIINPLDPLIPGNSIRIPIKEVVTEVIAQTSRT